MIKYTGEQLDNSNEGSFEGEFILNPITLRTGIGYHTHSDDRYNFPKIIIKNDNTFYVETKYLKPSQHPSWEFEEKFQAYIWKRRKN